MDERLVKRLVTNLKCGLCGARYRAVSVQVLGHHQELWFLRVDCPNCHHSSMVALAVKDGRVSQPITDLTPQEMYRLRDHPPLSCDEVLDMHLFLSNYQGNFSHLLSQ